MNKNCIKLDKKDKEILFELDLNARMPLTQLAKRIKLSPQTTKYRIERLEKKGVIRGYVTFFDASKFGYLYYRLYIRYENVSLEDEKRIIDYFKKHEDVVWFISTSGRWDLEILFTARNFIHFNKILKDVYAKFPDKLHNNLISVSIANYHQKRGYLLNKKTKVQLDYGGEPEIVKIDNLDKKIIRLINQNARFTSSEIGAKLDINYKTIQLRIKKLEEKGIIQAYRTWIDFKKIESLYYKSLIKLRKFPKEEENKILSFCAQNPNVIYLTTCVWPWDIELEVETQEEKTFLEILRSFRELMGDLIIDSENLTVTAEHKLNYCPFSEKLY
ncbi:MAG: winged helix-turn-helix transcriptional regulator [Nanoarchaeota archaeon]|nr:winged helix-turn-helix transcriptional regulator [Nanoarchaeota archaeon]